MVSLPPWQRWDDRFSALKRERDENVLPHWRTLSEFIAPRLGRYVTNDRNRVNKRNGRIVNGAARRAWRTLTNGMSMGITNPSRRWQRLLHKLYDQRDVQIYLQEVEEELFHTYERSNFYPSATALYGEQALFGIGAMGIYPDERNGMHCRPYTAGQYVVSHDYFGRVSCFGMEQELTLEQIVDEFGMIGEHRPSDEVLREIKKNPDQTRVVRFLFEQNTQSAPLDKDLINPDAMRAFEGFPIRAVYWDRDDSRRFLAVRGFHEMPVVAPRWDVVAEDSYGWSPAMDALADVMALQQTYKDMALQIELIGKPPVQGPPGLKNTGINIRPAAATFGDPGFQGGPAVGPVFQVRPEVEALRALVQDMVLAINEDFYADLFRLISNLTSGDRTAYEIRAKEEEKLLNLGSVFERERHEFLDPCNAITIGYLTREGRLPKPPESIANSDFAIEYISALSQIQRAQGLLSIDKLLQNAAALVQITQTPEPADKLDPMEILDQTAKMSGSPPAVLRSDIDARERGEARSRMAQMQQLTELAGDAAGAAKDASATNTTGENLMARFLENLGG